MCRAGGPWGPLPKPLQHPRSRYLQLDPPSDLSRDPRLRHWSLCYPWVSRLPPFDPQRHQLPSGDRFCLIPTVSTAGLQLRLVPSCLHCVSSLKPSIPDSALLPQLSSFQLTPLLTSAPIVSNLFNSSQFFCICVFLPDCPFYLCLLCFPSFTSPSYCPLL